MKAQWARLAARINALSVRERFLLFACVVGALGALTDRLFVSPLIREQKLVVAQLDRKSSDMDILRDKVNAEMLQRRRVRANELDSTLKQLQGEIDAVEREITALSAAGGETVAMSAMLTRVLRRAEKVALVRVVQLGGESIAVPTSGVAPTRGGLEFTLSGSYLDLMGYLASLEKTLPHARWGALRVRADTAPAQVTVRIVTSTAAS